MSARLAKTEAFSLITMIVSIVIALCASVRCGYYIQDNNKLASLPWYDILSMYLAMGLPVIALISSVVFVCVRLGSGNKF